MLTTIADGTKVSIKVASGAGVKEGKVVKSKYNLGDLYYLIEYEDETRGWERDKLVKRALPKPDHYDGAHLYDEITLVTIDDWEVLVVDGEVVYDGHGLNTSDLLDVLMVKHNYLNLDSAKELRYYIGEVYGEGMTRA